MIRRLYFLFLVLALVLLTACIDSNIKRRATELDNEITDYNVGLRWLMLNRIEAYHVSKDGKKTPLDRTAYNEIRVTDCNVEEKTMNTDVTKATVKGEVSYYRTDIGALRKIPYTQTWWYNKKQKRWFVDSDYLKFK